MNDERVILQSKSVEIAETMSNGNIRAKFVICDFGVNKNKLQINNEKIVSWYQSIVNQPLVGRIKNGDFTGHNLKVIPYIDEAGEVQKRVELDTDAFGTFVSSAIEKIDGVECLTATAEIWSRFPRAFNLVKTRIENGTLYSSFEIKVNEYRYVDGIKIVDDAVFTAHCCLGKNVDPAYDTSRLLEVAEYDDGILQALEEDIAEQKAKEGNDIVENVEEKVVTAEEESVRTGNEESTAEVVVEEVAESTDENADETANEGTSENVGDDSVEETAESTTEVAALTDRDLRFALEKACSKFFDNRYCWVCFIFPTDYECWVKKDGFNDLEYMKVTYAIQDDVVTIVDAVEVSLVASPKDFNAAIAERDTALATANDSINALNDEIATLTPFKERYEKEEAERLEAEKQKLRSELCAYALSSKLIKQEELETSEELKMMIQNVDKSGIRQIIGQRFMESLNNQKPMEIASAEDVAVPKTIVDEDVATVSIINAYVHKKNK